MAPTRSPHIAIVVAELQEHGLWRDLERRSGVPSHGWSNAYAFSQSGLSPILACLQSGDAQMILPVHRRPWHGRMDISTIVSVSGASIRGPADPLLQAWSRHAASQGWVAGYLQFDPACINQLGNAAEPGNAVFLLDLSPEDPLAGVSTIISRKVRKADQIGVHLIEDRHVLGAALITLHPAAMARSGATVHYGFSAPSLQAWATAPESLVLGSAVNGEIHSVVVFLVTGERAEFHLGASSPDGRSLSAWLLCQAIRRLKTMGVQTLNLGGGVRPGDGLYQFKQKFGGVETRLPVVKQIYLPDVYEQLCGERGVASGETWFPAYRGPSAQPTMARP